MDTDNLQYCFICIYMDKYIDFKKEFYWENNFE